MEVMNLSASKGGSGEYMRMTKGNRKVKIRIT